MSATMLCRAFFIELKRRLKGERISHFSYLDDVDFQQMRSDLARWAQDNGEALGLVEPVQPEGFINRTASNWRLMFAIADSLGEGERARAIAQHIAGVTDMASAGVNLLRDIKAHFDASTLDYVKSKALIDHLVADPEKPWVEWSRGKPLSEKALADLLHEYNIFSRNVGPRESQAKGYRRADFVDAWQRYLTPEGDKEGGEEEGALDSSILPSTRPRDCNDYRKAEKSAVHEGNGGRGKIDPFSSEINAVDGWTGKKGDSEPSPLSATDDGIPTSLRRCKRCGKSATPSDPVVPCGENGSAGHYHLRCWTEERTKGRVQPQDARPLTSGRAYALAKQYLERAVDEHDNNLTGAVNSAAHDAWLRTELRAEVPPAQVEAAFAQFRCKAEWSKRNVIYLQGHMGIFLKELMNDYRERGTRNSLRGADPKFPYIGIR